jgi:hypothetical protein
MPPIGRRPPQRVVLAYSAEESQHEFGLIQHPHEARGIVGCTVSDSA